MKPVLITYPKYIDEVSLLIGKNRNDKNIGNMNRNPQYKRGGMEEQIDVLGVKGEIIFSNYLFQKGVEHEINTLIADRPVCDYDVKVKNKKIDVKSINKNAPHFLVNEKAHNKKKMDYYVFVMPIGNCKAYMWKYSYSDVFNWSVKFFKYTNAYYKEVQY
jgi:hypothetical protein